MSKISELLTMIFDNLEKSNLYYSLKLGDKAVYLVFQVVIFNVMVQMPMCRNLQKTHC